MKKCYKCGIEKAFSEFSKDKSRKDEFTNKCKACCKTYYQKNREKIKEQCRIYHHNNKQKQNERCRIYRQNNNQKERERCKIYKKNNPEAVRKYVRKRRATKKAVEENYTNDKATATEIAFGFKCFNCSSTESLAHDHNRPLSKGHPLDIGNSVLLCRSCNASKKDKDPEDFYSEEQLAELEIHFKVQRDIYTLAYLHKV